MLPKIKIIFVFVCVILTILIVPVSATDYNVGVIQGNYVKFGNFVGNGTGLDMADFGWMKYEVIAVSGKNVTIEITAIFKNSTAHPISGSRIICDIESGSVNDSWGGMEAIIAANLTQGDRIPSALLFRFVNRTENRIYFGLDRTVNVLETNSTSLSSTTIHIDVFDKASGMLLESQYKETSDGVTSIASYSVIETNIFTGEPIPEFPSFILMPLLMVAVAIGTLLYRKKVNQAHF